VALAVTAAIVFMAVAVPKVLDRESNALGVARVVGNAPPVSEASDPSPPPPACVAVDAMRSVEPTDVSPDTVARPSACVVVLRPFRVEARPPALLL
jgi:hypothetical protein